jgi:hypothetical protein
MPAFAFSITRIRSFASWDTFSAPSAFVGLTADGVFAAGSTFVSPFTSPPGCRDFDLLLSKRLQISLKRRNRQILTGRVLNDIRVAESTNFAEACPVR